MRCHSTLLLAILLAGLGLFLDCGPAKADQAKYLFKVASLAPEGSVWTKRFRDFAEEVTTKTNGEVVFKIYAGGVMGDDRAMYRKMRAGQIQGGGFTMTGIGEFVPDFRVLGIPFLCNSYDEVDHLWKSLWPQLKKDFAEQGLELMAVTEVGFIYAMSASPISTMEELRKSKSWTPDGDPVSKLFLETAGASPTPLAIPDVLTSLQTGLINAVFNSFYGSIVLQWFTRTPYITDVPFVYGYGALVLDRTKFAELPPAHAAVMEAAARTHFASLLADARQSNVDSLQVLRDNGVTLVKATPATQAELHAAREQTVTKLVDKAFSRAIYDQTIQALAEFRRPTPPSPAPPEARKQGRRP